MKKILFILLLLPLFAFPQTEKRYRSIIIDSVKALNGGVIDIKDIAKFENTIRLSDGKTFEFLSGVNTGTFQLLGALAGNRTWSLPAVTGTFTLGTGTANKIASWSATNSIQGGPWEFSGGGALFPGTDGFSIGISGTNRVETIFMDGSARIDFATTLIFDEAGSERMRIQTGGGIGIGTSGAPDASALLEISSTTKGFLPSKMTTAQKDAIGSPASGLQVYTTDSNKLNVYNGTEWRTVSYEKGIEAFFLQPRGLFGSGPGFADNGFIGDVPVILFASNSTKKAIYTFFALSRVLLADTNPKVAFVVYATTAPIVTTGDSVRWQLQARYIAETEEATKTPDETILFTQRLPTLLANTRQTILQFTLNRALMTDQDVLLFTLSRIGGDALDTYAVDVGIGQSGIILETRTHNP